MYDPNAIQAYYDALGEGEWLRLEKNAHARLIFALHWHFLREVLSPGMRVLDAGCGAGRFALPMPAEGTEVTLLDISPVQIELARQKVGERFGPNARARFAVGDICALSDIADASYDAVLCYGASLNYVGDGRLQAALTELMRVAKPGAPVVTSVNSRLGVLRFTMARTNLEDVLDFYRRADSWRIRETMATGDLPYMPEVGHPPRHFFLADELRARFAACGLRDIELGCAPSVFSGFYAALEAVGADERAWSNMLTEELAHYRMPGLSDSGEFLLLRGRA